MKTEREIREKIERLEEAIEHDEAGAQEAVAGWLKDQIRDRIKRTKEIKMVLEWVLT